MWAWACGSALQLTLQALEDRDRLALAHLHDGLLPLARAPRGVAAALGLGRHRRGADLEHADVEELLDRLLDLGLVRVRVDPERVLADRRQRVRLLGDDRLDDHLTGVHQAATSSARDASLRARAVTDSSASAVSTIVAAPTMSATPQSSAASTLTPARLRKDLKAVASSGPDSTTSTEPPRRSAIRSAACLVEGASNAPASSPNTEPRSAWIESALRSAARRALRLTLTV